MRLFSTFFFYFLLVWLLGTPEDANFNDYSTILMRSQRMSPSQHLAVAPVCRRKETSPSVPSERILLFFFLSLVRSCVDRAWLCASEAPPVSTPPVASEAPYLRAHHLPLLASQSVLSSLSLVVAGGRTEDPSTKCHWDSRGLKLISPTLKNEQQTQRTTPITITITIASCCNHRHHLRYLCHQQLYRR